MRLEALHKKNLVKAKKIIADQLVLQVYSLKTPKIFASLTNIFEGKNIDQNMTLRTQLKNVKIQNAETIQSYFTRVSQLKEQIEAVKEEVKNAEVVMAILNGLPGSWDSFIRGMCARRKWLISVDSGKRTHKKNNLKKRRWEQLKIKLLPSKEDPSSNEEYEELNSWRTSYPP